MNDMSMKKEKYSKVKNDGQLFEGITIFSAIKSKFITWN